MVVEWYLFEQRGMLLQTRSDVEYILNNGRAERLSITPPHDVRRGASP